MTPDELWEKYSADFGGCTDGHFSFFKAALSEYGAAIRKRDAEIACKLFADHYDHSQKKVGAMDCAAAISREPLR